MQVFEQLLSQMATRCFFDRAPLGGYCFLLRLAFSSRPPFDRFGQMRNLRAVRPDSSFLWLRVGIHKEMLALLAGDKKNGNSNKLKNN